MTLIMISLAAAGIFAYDYLARANVFPAGLVQTNGRLEGDKVIVASKVPGRIVKLLVKEGDVVTAGQVLALLDDQTARNRLDQALAARDVAVARAESARVALHVLRLQVLNGVASAEAGVKSVEVALQKAEVTREQAYRDVQRFRKLVENRTVDFKTAEQAELNWQLAEKEPSAVRAELSKAQQTLNEAQLGPGRIKAHEAELEALQAAVREAAVRVNEAQDIVNDFKIVSPAAGTVMTRFANLGEVVNVGMPLFELVDLDNLYLKAYVPEVEIGKLHLGLPAQIYTDVFPDQPFSAKLRYIASRAEFTPKEVQTRDERTKLVYAMKLYLDANPDHRLTPGLPVDAVIRWQEDAPWTKPRW
ncbi:MAG: efflux RND transporter periplasmic adaptor subunit [Candidatus Competibacteraceae bacterium]